MNELHYNYTACCWFPTSSKYFNTSITVLTNQVWKLMIALFKVPNTGAFMILKECELHCTTPQFTDSNEGTPPPPPPHFWTYWRQFDFAVIRLNIKFVFSGATFHIPLSKSATLNRLLHCSLWRFSGALYWYLRALFCNFWARYRPEPPCIFFPWL